MAFEHGRALIIGVGKYIHHPKADRPMAAEDARQVAQVLADKQLCGYLPEHVKLLTNQAASRQAILQALANLATASKEDTVFLFYSGHGALGTDGNYYLTACDTHFADGRVNDGGISENELLGLLRKVPARRMILLFHACFSGELSPDFSPEEPEDVESMGLPNSTVDAILGSGEGRIIITSSRDGQKSWAKWGQPTSFFTQALLEGLRGEASNNSGYIGAFGLYEYVYQTVKESAQMIGKEQEPVLTVLQGVGPFPLALHRGSSKLGSFSLDETLPEEIPVRRVSEKASQRSFDRRVVHTGGGAYIEGNVNTGGGDFVGRDQNKVNVQGGISGGTLVVGNRNTIGAQQTPGSVAGLAQLIREIRSLLPQAGLDVDTRKIVEDDIQVVEEQMAKPEPKKALVLPKLKSIADVLGYAAAAGQAMQKLAPMLQQAMQWAGQLLK